MDYKVLGEKIRLERKKQGLTIEELAHRADISPNFLGKIERAQSVMSLDTLIKVVNALNISSDELLGHEVNSVSPARVDRISQKLMHIPEKNQKDCVALIDMIIDYFLHK